ncbi:TIGR03067 domain-containing protein [Planctomycetaceae bacterium SH139]
MRTLFLGVLLSLSVNAWADQPPETERQDSQLNGVWVLKSIERRGEKVEGDGLPERMRGTTRTIAGAEMVLSRGGGTRELRLSIDVNTSRKPKHMDITAERNGKTQVLECVYEIKDGMLRIAENTTERPDSFKTDSTTRTMVTTYTRKGKPPRQQTKDAEPSDQPKSR